MFHWIHCSSIPVATETLRESNPLGSCLNGWIVKSLVHASETSFGRPSPSLPVNGTQTYPNNSVDYYYIGPLCFPTCFALTNNKHGGFLRTVFTAAEQRDCSASPTRSRTDRSYHVPSPGNCSLDTQYRTVLL